ncbi:putative exported protein [Halobacteriovorax marinus SJ]|uniref:Exported protein n=1 Tax=Halobacteriovorax marinus (strain ATCC BAA-682 / DSM 15412 / SJ) TaxID=862908 RepID=E1X0S5_HALMS|nr:hypothetical protein [Halobacteriovorax marinus]CBW26413.1 putative exported protein [Halobacteriovorax marinus SJ]
MLKLIFSLFFLFSLSAEELSQVQAEHSFSNTSDGLKLKEYDLEYRTHRRDLFWLYEDEASKAHDFFLRVKKVDGEHLGEIDGTRFILGYGRKWNESHNSEISFGMHTLSYKNNSSKTPYFNFLQQYRAKLYTLEYSMTHDFYYLIGGVPGPYEEKLKSLKNSIRLVATPRDFLRVPVEIEYTKISGDNSRNRQSASILFGDSYPIWIWLGYRIERLSFDRLDSGYWSPDKFLAHGPHLEWAQTFFSNYTFKLSYLYNFIKENDFASGNSYYLSSTFEYGNRNSLLLGFNVYRNKSMQESSEWWSEGGRVYLKYSF